MLNTNRGCRSVGNVMDMDTGHNSVAERKMQEQETETATYPGQLR